MNETAERGPNLPPGCAMRPERASICGLDHRLVESPSGHGYWCDPLFMDLLARCAGPTDAAAPPGVRNGISREMTEAGLSAVRALFSKNAVPRAPVAGNAAEAPRADAPLVSIVIVNWNGAAHLEGLLRSIREQSYRKIEVVVVDNGSRDDSLRILAAFPEVAVYPQERNVGFCRGNNLGIEKSKGEILFLLNNDTVLDPRCVERAVACLAKSPPDVLGVFPMILFHDAPQVINCAGVQWHCRHMWRDNTVGMLDIPGVRGRERVFGGIFAGVFLRRAAFKALGLFDERFVTYGEDFDVCYRANLAGYDFILEPGAVVYHKYRASSREGEDLFFSLYYFLRNYPLVILKNYEARNVLPALRYFREEFWAPWAARARREPEVRALLRRVLRGLVRMAPHILRERARARRMRKVRDRDLWVWDPLDRFNIFHYEGNVVLNRINLEASLRGNARYVAGGEGYVVFGGSARIPAPREAGEPVRLS